MTTALAHLAETLQHRPCCVKHGRYCHDVLTMDLASQTQLHTLPPSGIMHDVFWRDYLN